MESLCPLQKLKMVYFFTVGKSLAVISSVRRMIVVILKVLFLGGEIRTSVNQDVTGMRS